MNTRLSYAIASTVLLVLGCPILLRAQKPLPVASGLSKEITLPALFGKGKLFRLNAGDFNAGYSYFRDTSGLGLGHFSQLSGIAAYDALLSLSVAEIPFDVSFRGNNGIYTLQQPSFNQLGQFHFNKEEYIRRIKSQMEEKISPEQLKTAITERIAIVRSKYEHSLNSELGSIQSTLKKETGRDLNLPAEATDLSKSDISSLQTKLLSGKEAEQYRQSILVVQEKLKQKDAATLEVDSVYKQHLGNVKQYEALEKACEKIAGWRKRFQEDKTVQQLKADLPIGNIDRNILKNAKEQFNLTTLQRLFCNVTHLNIGQTPLDANKELFSPQGLMNSGFGAGYKTGKAEVEMMYGKNNNTNSWLQQGLSSAVTNEYSSITGFKFGTGSESVIEQSVAFQVYNIKANNNIQSQGIANYLPSPAHSSAVLSLHTGLPIGGKHKVELDLSKSFGSFSNGSYYDSASGKNSSTGSLIGGGGLSNYAAHINYEGEWWAVPVNAYVKKVGLGYNNPGNYLLRRGETQIGGGFNKQFYRRKLSLKYQTDYRTQQFDPSRNYSYSSFSNKFQSGYRFKRNNRISLTYHQTNYQSTLKEEQASAGNSKRWQLDGAYQWKHWHKVFMNNTALSWQQMKMPLLSGTFFSNRSLMFTHTTSVPFKQDLLSVSVIMNRSNNQEYFFNTSMFSTETSYACALSAVVRLSSGLGYYANAGWNRQLGINQQLSASIGGKWELDLQAGARKAVKQTQTLLANQLYFNSNVRYHF